MTNLLQVVLLGIIEGVTEFLPISSTGHLLIAERLGLGQRSEVFNIVIQAGAILAVTAIYWRRLVGLAFGLTDPSNRDYAYKLLASFGITAVLGLVVKKLGIELPEELAPVAWALIIGGIWIVVAERVAAKHAGNPRISWLAAVAVGVAQIVAGVFPGTSRSAASIFAAMLCGTSDRGAATEFGFLVGIPTMYAASGYALLKQLKQPSAGDSASDIAIAFVIATITAFLVVKWLIRYIQTNSFTPFAIYRVVLGIGLLALAPSV